MVSAFVMAAIASLGVLVSLGGALAGVNNPATAIIIGLVIIVMTTVPTTIGTGLAWAALRRGGPNPIGVWIALVWNLLLLAAILLMMILNSLMR